MTEPRQNRLAASTSPYLLQHAANPVEWYPWGEEALARARREDKPILLSIGYSACHWCHVMAHESFEDEAIGAQMSRDFVCIKVDREERPDLDDIYMAATLAMNGGQGGWPMTVFLTPEQEPFFAGTYFPPEDRWGRPGFRTLLTRIAGAWKDERDTIREQGARMAALLQDSARAAPGLKLGEDEIRQAVDALRRGFDPTWGGFGPAPKFPPSGALSLLLRAHRRFGDEQALPMVRRTLDAMARGGMYDQLAGGFHRYSVDERWLVPHFEKMLYDNALLPRAYLAGFAVTADPFYARVAQETLDYVLREMTAPEGPFHSATDADSEGVEGRFFVWTPEQVRAELDAEAARLFCAHYDVTEAGNWEGASILNTPLPLDDVAVEAGISPEQLEASLRASRAILYEARSRRVAPGLDDKVLTGWNGLMIGALAEGARVLGLERYREAAERAADFVLAELRTPQGALLRTWRRGRAHLSACLEDYAYLAEGLLDLYEAGGAHRYLDAALELAEAVRERFVAPEGGFYSVAEDHERLVVRFREGHDGAVPNPNAVAAHVLARLGFHTGRDELREEAARAVRAYGNAIAGQPRGFLRALEVVDLLLEGPVELALVGVAGAGDRRALEREVHARYLPNRVVAHADPAAAPGRHPLLEGRSLVGGRAALYLCREFTCLAPITEPAQVGPALERDAGAREADRSLRVPRRGGRATPEATAAHAGRFPEAAGGFAGLGRSGLTCSRLGFGGYRVDDETPEHREALAQALAGGVNLIDTSTNYADGGSERLVGGVLSQPGIARDEIVVVTKVGYIQGENLRVARERARRGEPFQEVVVYGEHLWHCLHPGFLADQLERSLERLRLESLDVLLLHNPEYFLSEAARRPELPLEARRDAFYGRLERAFAWLEEQVRAGRLAWYGVSSNTCTAPADDPEATCLTRMWDAARRGAGDTNHFAVLQLPMNLLESGAVFEPNSGEGARLTVLEEARALGIGVLVNRPLNAIVGGDLVRLADFATPEHPEDLAALLDALEGMEREYVETIASEFETTGGSLPPVEFFRWAGELRGLAPRLGGNPQWKQIETGFLLPRVSQRVALLDRSLTGPTGQRWQAFKERYLPALQSAMRELDRAARERSAAAVAPIAAVLDAGLPAEQRSETLSRKALWLLASTPGVGSVLVGMREPGYVRDALGILGWPALERHEAVWDDLRRSGARRENDPESGNSTA
jgi:hypothetical protein